MERVVGGYDILCHVNTLLLSPVESLKQLVAAERYSVIIGEPLSLQLFQQPDAAVE